MYSHYLPERTGSHSSNYSRYEPITTPKYSYLDDRMDHYVERINRTYHDVTTRPHSSLYIRKSGDFYMTNNKSNDS
ncbi:unnamed protein product [Brachionus calyciflorus]|uniref:Uncharacterized protein n=1 Tax=Brachionus calyciflorus TaxID=104777 RepID=A0A813M814_9BILA|nr:unnamed protein product [Brachionus calyciflorus]